MNNEREDVILKSRTQVREIGLAMQDLMAGVNLSDLSGKTDLSVATLGKMSDGNIGSMSVVNIELVRRALTPSEPHN